jgi:hypothetical protein
MFWSLDDAPAILRWYRDLVKSEPEDISGFFSCNCIPPVPPFPEELHGRKMCAIIWCCTGDFEKAAEVLQRLKEYRTPVIDGVGPMPFPTLQTMFDPILPTGLQWYWKGSFVEDIPEEAITIHMQQIEGMPIGPSFMHLYPVNGVAARVSNRDTAWNHRGATWAMVIAGVGEKPDSAGLISEWAKEYANALHPYTMGNSYVNFMMAEGEAKVKDTYGDNFKRLVQIKETYDPGNLFRINQNIRPFAG